MTPGGTPKEKYVSTVLVEVTTNVLVIPWTDWPFNDQWLLQIHKDIGRLLNEAPGQIIIDDTGFLHWWGIENKKSALRRIISQI